MLSTLSPADHGPAILTASEFNAAVAPVMPALTRYARRLAITSADTDDLVQDTLLRAWAARTSFRPRSNFRAWIMRIARNSFLSLRRRMWRQVLWEPDEIARALTTGMEQEEAVMLENLANAVATLPVPQRQAFEMVAVENLSYEDAAGRLSVELGTLKSRVSRARAALVLILETIPPACPVEPRPAEPLRETDAPLRRNIYAEWKASGGRLIGEPRTACDVTPVFHPAATRDRPVLSLTPT